MKSFSIVRIEVFGQRSIQDQSYYGKLLDMLRILKKGKAKIYIHYLVTEENLHLMERVGKDLRKYYDMIAFNPVTYVNGKLKPFKSKKFIETFNLLQKRLPSNQIKSFMQPDPKVGKKYCDAGKLYFHIRPNGDITPCSHLNEVMGNILVTPLNEILKRRSKIDSIKKCRGCFSRGTTEISMFIRRKPIQLLSFIPKIIMRYRL